VEREKGGKHYGAYLWSLALEDFRSGQMPKLVMAEENGGAFEFQNKAEGMAVLPNGALFIVYDPDRKLEIDRQHKRGCNEAPYTLVQLLE
jgi:hypothetical protein